MLAEHMFGPHNDSPITTSNPEEFAMAKLKLTYFDFDGGRGEPAGEIRSEEHTSELQSRVELVCRLLLEKKKKEIQQKDIAKMNGARQRARKVERKYTPLH